MLARLPQGMSNLAIVLLLSPRLGYGRAGFATGVTIATAGLSNVALARAADRYGARLVLVGSATGYAAAMIGLAVDRDGGYAGLLAICAAAGLATPPVTAVARGIWPSLLDPEATRVVYGLEASAQEVVFIGGPALVALLAAVAGRSSAVVVTGLAGLVGAIAYVSAPPLGGRRPHRQATRTPVLFATGMLRYVGVGVFITAGLSMIDLATVGFAGGRSASTASGVLLAVWSAGSMVGGLAFGARTTDDTDHGLAIALAIMAAGIAVAAAAPNRIGLGALLFLGGAAIAPAFARLYARVSATTPSTATTEAFGWLAVGFLVGSALGAALGGVLVDATGPRATFVLAAVTSLGAIVALRRHR